MKNSQNVIKFGYSINDGNRKSTSIKVDGARREHRFYDGSRQHRPMSINILTCRTSSVSTCIPVMHDFKEKVVSKGVEAELLADIKNVEGGIQSQPVRNRAEIWNELARHSHSAERNDCYFTIPILEGW